MIVPRYWAEGRLRHRGRERQITVRRFGWSDASQDEAQANADQRTREALDRRLSGEKLPERDPKVPYNGADGVPIREEIVGRHREAIITRNSYGARCLNVADVLFADIDSHPRPTRSEVRTLFGLASLLSAVTFWLMRSGASILAWPVGFFAVISVVGLTEILHRCALAWRSKEQNARGRLRRFVAEHPGWNLRVYRTPAGLRALAMHRLFRPDSGLVDDFFRAVGVDKAYAKMCLHQQCFRARVSPKPWRAGILDHLKPRPGTWPVKPERLPARTAWIERYETVARAFAACEFVETLGSGVEHPDAKYVQEVHDEMCGANTGRPLA